MQITEVSAPLYLQPKAMPPLKPVSGVVEQAAAEPTAKSGARGISLLSADAAAVVLAEQATPIATVERIPEGLDLRGRDLREVDLTKMDLRRADLSGSNLSGKDLTHVDLSGANLSKANLDGANLTGAVLSEANAEGASFIGVTLVRTTINGGNFSNTKFGGAYFSDIEKGGEVDASGQRKPDRIYSVKSGNFTNADFSKATVTTMAFDKSKFDGAKFDDSDVRISIKDSSAVNSSLKNFKGLIEISKSDISGADFSKSEDSYLKIHSSKIGNASIADSRLILLITNSDIRNMNLSVKGKEFSRTSFSNVNMAGVNFSGYKFSASHFSADKHDSDVADDRLDNILTDGLKGTNFAGAEFFDVGFSGRAMDLNKANFEGASFTRSSFDAGARIDKVGSIIAALSAGKVSYAVPGLVPGSSASPDSPFRGFSTPEDRTIEDWLYSLMPSSGKTSVKKPSGSAVSGSPEATTATTDAAVAAFDMREALTKAGAFDGLDPDSDISDEEYNQIGAIFRNVRISMEAGHNLKDGL